MLANTHEIPVAESLCAIPTRACRSTQLLEKLRFAAGAERVETLDAQALARGVPRRLDRLQHPRAGLRVAARPGAGRPGGAAARDRAEWRRGREQQGGVLARPARRRATRRRSRALLHEPAPASARSARDARRADRALRRASSTGYQNAAYARPLSPHSSPRCGARGGVARRRRRPAAHARGRASSCCKLMAYKDEYEVARLYTDGEFRAALAEQFEGDDRSSSSTWRRRCSRSRRRRRASRRKSALRRRGCCRR